MKNILSLFLASFLVVSIHAQGEDSFLQGGYKYCITSDTTVSIADEGMNTPLPVTGDSTLILPSSVEYKGRKYRVNQIYPSFGGHQEIKHLVVSEGVECINARSFSRCVNLESIHFPSTLRSFGEFEIPFMGCSSLQRITVDGRNKIYDSREDCNALMHTEDSTLVMGCLGTKIPSTAATIGNSAFAFCEKMVSVNIPEGVRRIEGMAFRNCPNLKKVSLPNTLESLSGRIFDGCMSLESITIPQNVSKIHGTVFAGCHNLREVKVDKNNRTYDSRKNCNAIIDTEQDTLVAGCGNSVIVEGIKGIGSMAFYRSAIREIKIPASVRSIGAKAFLLSEFCSSISVDSRNPVYNSKDNCNAIIETATGTLLQGCRNTTIPKGVGEIGDNAFLLVQMPPYLVIPEGVEIIGEYAFAHCKDIENIQMPSSLKRIKEGAFSDCRMCYVDMSGCNATIDGLAFSNCPNLYTVNISSSKVNIAHSAFWNAPCETWVKKFTWRVK